MAVCGCIRHRYLRSNRFISDQSMLRRRICLVILTATLAALIGVEVNAAEQRRRTTRKNLRLAPANITATVAAPDTILVDSIATADGEAPIRLSGYDKPLRSPRESLFVTNNTTLDIDGIVLALDYFDKSGRKIHSRSVTVRCDLPKGQTRKIDFASWDIQQSFYYKLSPQPRRDGASPYDIRCHATAIIVPSTSGRTNPD